MAVASNIISFQDRLVAMGLRLGIGRDNTVVTPGLYALNGPGPDSPVLVSANYRLSFDRLRGALPGMAAWILVLDTRGVNVWCAAGKGTFGTAEILRQIEQTDLANVVSHRRLILPQLGAPGVAAHEIKEQSGFKVIYGPVEARDIPQFIADNMKATNEMRTKRFPLRERAVLVPLELIQSWKVLVPVLFLSVLLTFFIDGWATLSFAVDGLPAILGVLAGAVVTPLVLPVTPFRAFAAKGGFVGAITATAWALVTSPAFPQLALGVGVVVSLSSFAAMNFTGASTYTSLSGVKKEMKWAVPAQITVAALALIARVVFGLIG